jgi:hypothetical protein
MIYGSLSSAHVQCVWSDLSLHSEVFLHWGKMIVFVLEGSAAGARQCPNQRMRWLAITLPDRCSNWPHPLFLVIAETKNLGVAAQCVIHLVRDRWMPPNASCFTSSKVSYNLEMILPLSNLVDHRRSRCCGEGHGPMTCSLQDHRVGFM